MIDSEKSPLIIAGPCLGESFPIMEEVASAFSELSKSLGFQFLFKSSFDKANRQSINSYRSPGQEKVLSWFSDIKSKYKCKTITDVHESYQVEEVQDVIDALQIPAFLCRQTDLIVKAVESGKPVNIKKGQFMNPHAMKHVIGKARAAKSEENSRTQDIMITERGSSFGYSDLVVDMRSFSIMDDIKAPMLFDMTHSTQRPGTADTGSSHYTREYAPLLARAAAATGKLAGFFMEVHPNPSQAKSDAGAQLSIRQAEMILKQILPLWHEAKTMQNIDREFQNT